MSNKNGTGYFVLRDRSSYIRGPNFNIRLMEKFFEKSGTFEISQYIDKDFKVDLGTMILKYIVDRNASESYVYHVIAIVRESKFNSIHFNFHIPIYIEMMVTEMLKCVEESINRNDTYISERIYSMGKRNIRKVNRELSSNREHDNNDKKMDPNSPVFHPKRLTN